MPAKKLLSVFPFYEAMEKVMAEPFLAYFMTDDEILELINYDLEKHEKLPLSVLETFARTKKTRSQRLQMFLRKLKHQRGQFKAWLWGQMISSERGWQRFAWILERKYPEWASKMQSVQEAKDFTIKKWEFMPFPTEIDEKRKVLERLMHEKLD